jgi:prepilin peptidase CpaA
MNLVALSPGWLAWLLALLLVAAATEDAIRMRVSNLISFGVLALAVVAIALVGLDLRLWQNLVVFLALLAGGTLLFSTGKFGGGDVKLLAALGLWVDFRGALALLIGVSLAGGLLALLILAARMFASEAAAKRVIVLKAGAGIPYGVAIAIGAIITLLLNRS